jgi:hypothetical protein
MNYMPLSLITWHCSVNDVWSELHDAGTFLEKLVIVHLVNKFPSVMKAKCSLTCSQHPAIVYCPAQLESSVHLHTQFLRFVLILYYNIRPVFRIYD